MIHYVFPGNHGALKVTFDWNKNGPYLETDSSLMYCNLFSNRPGLSRACNNTEYRLRLHKRKIMI